MKTIKILIISLSVILILSHNVYAIGNILSKGELWDETGKTEASQGLTLDSVKLQEASNQLYNVLIVVATAVAIITGIILGIRYMTAGIDSKVQVKESLFPYLISCIVAFGSLGIWKLLVSIIKQI